MRMKRLSCMTVAMTLLLMIASPWTANGQDDKPLKEPFTIQFEIPADLQERMVGASFVQLLEQLPLTISNGKLSEANSGNFSHECSATNNDKSCEYKYTYEISGTFEDGALQGTWTFEEDSVKIPAQIIWGSIITKSESKGSFKSMGTVTSEGAEVSFQGTTTVYYSDYEAYKVTHSNRPHDKDLDETLKLTVIKGGQPQPGETASDEKENAEHEDGGNGSNGQEENKDSLPGLGSIGDIPGPDNPLEAAAGLLLPGIIGIIGGLLMGGGGTGLAEPPTEESPETDPDESDKDDEGGDEGSDKDPLERGPLDPATEHAKHVIDIFDKRSVIDKNVDLKEVIDQARERAFDENGKLIPAEWTNIENEMRDAIKAHAGEPGSTSIIGETIDGIANTAEDIPAKVKYGLEETATGIGKGLKNSAEGWGKLIMYPEDFARGLLEGVKDWNQKNTQEWDALNQAMDQASQKEGELGVMKVMADSYIKSGGKLLGAILEIGKGLLPVEELEVLTDPNSTIEEMAWAIPSAVVKTAALLVGTEIGAARVPGTGASTLIPSARTAAAVEEATVVKAAEGGVAKAAEGGGAKAAESAGAKAAGEEAAASKGAKAASAEEAGGAKAAERPKPGDKVEAPAEAKTREAQKTAERQAEYAKGDAERTKSEAMFNDPKQRPAYESGYKDYMDNAQKKVDTLVDTVGNGEKISVAQVAENSSDAAAMRDLKGADEAVRKGFNETLNKEILEPTNRDVESFLGGKDHYPGEKIKVESVRTPGKKYNPEIDINTDNDIHAVRKVTNPDGSTTWEEIPSEEWKQTYHDSFAKNSGFNVETAKERFPDADWDHMTQQQQTQKWGELHQQEPGDVFDPTSGRDFKPGSAGTGTGEAAHAAAKSGTGKLTDAQQLGMMEQEKFTKAWNKGTIPEQKEALEQLSKQGREVEGLIDGYKKNYNVSDLSPDMKEALKIIKDNNLSPLERAQRVKDLGFDGGPAQVNDELRSKIESLKIAKRK